MGPLAEPAENDSTGRGGVMRMAPVGLAARSLYQQVCPGMAFDLGIKLAALPHGHPTGSLTRGTFATMILALTDGVPLPATLEAVNGLLRT